MWPAGWSPMHPLAAEDGAVLARLEEADPPDFGDLVDAARLLSRYPAGEERERLQAVIHAWGFSIETLREETRRLWASGWRPPMTQDLTVGSGADVTDSTA